MSNPVPAIPNAQVPWMDTPLVTAEDTSTVVFHRFLTGLWERTGGAKGINTGDVQQVAQNATNAANAANGAANVASNAASNAQISANQAQATATAASQTAATALSTAQTAQTASLQKTQNLADIANPTSARINLGLNTFPVTFSFDTCPAGLRRGVPLVRNLMLPANLTGTVCWHGIAPTLDATFAVMAYRGNFYIPIGTILFVHGAGFTFSTQAAFPLIAGDTLIVQCPSPADASLAEVAITFPLTLA